MATRTVDRRRSSVEFAFLSELAPIVRECETSIMHSLLDHVTAAAAAHQETLEHSLPHEYTDALRTYNDKTTFIDQFQLTTLECCFVALCQGVVVTRLQNAIKKRTAKIEAQKELLESKGFVYLREFDPTIIERIRYSSSENFVGTTLNGYHACTRSVITREAAQALSNVQRTLNSHGYNLVVYDTYRPQRAVDHIVEWTHDHDDEKERANYYPEIEKCDILRLGFVHPCSGHSRGSTVDLSIIAMDKTLRTELVTEQRQLSDGTWIPFLDDGTVDMGTSFDFFGKASMHDSDLVSQEQTQMRNYLRDVMQQHGFTHLPEEWWHYSLADEPFANTYFDFVLDH